MKKCLIAMLLASFAWVAPMSASDRSYVPAVYTGGSQAELVGHRHKHKHKRHHHHRRAHSRHHHHRHHSYNHYRYRYHRPHHHDCYTPYRSHRTFRIVVPGFSPYYY